jgi:hypothetical protein
LFKFLRFVDGVAEVQSWRSEGGRISFSPRGEPFLVHESWGNSSRCWAGPTEESHPAADITPLHPAFEDDLGSMDRLRERTKP